MAKKRENGDGGAPRLRRDGRWQADYTAYDKNGKPKRRSVVAKTKAECNSKLRQILSEIRAGTYTEPNRTPFGDWIMEYFRLYGEPRWKSMNTRNVHLSNIRSHLLPTFKDTPLVEMTPPRVQEFFNGLTRSGLRPGTVHKILEPLTLSLQKAVDLGMLASNPCKKIELPPMRQDEVKHLGSKEMSKLSVSLPDDTLGRACGFILMTGLRSSEIAGLRWEDVDFSTEVVFIKRSACYQKVIENAVQAEHQSLIISPTKSRKGYREIALLPESVDVLKRQRIQQNEDAIRAADLWLGGMPGSPEMYVFANGIGRVMVMSTVRNYLKRTLRDLCMQVVSLHPLRHSALTEMAKNGSDPRTLAEIAGHVKVAFTMDKYCHSDIETKRKAMQPLRKVAANGVAQQQADSTKRSWSTKKIVDWPG